MRPFRFPKLRVAGSTPVSRSRNLNSGRGLRDSRLSAVVMCGEIVGSLGRDERQEVGGNLAALEGERLAVVVTTAPASVVARGDLEVRMPELA